MLKKILEMIVDSFFTELKEPAKEVPTMKLRLNRTWFSDTTTIGELYVDDEFECYTLEDEDKLRHGLKKVYGLTAIPKGKYYITITYSPKYKRKMPLLMNVPQFSGIRIHSGNKAEDTEGCILVGRTKRIDWIGQSRLAYNALFKKLSAAFDEGKRITIEVE